MTDISIRGYHDENYLLQRLLGTSDVPAFIKRARRVQEAWESLLSDCRRHHDEYLGTTRTRLDSLGRFARNWEDLASYIRDVEEVSWLRSLCQALALEPQWACERTPAAGTLRRELRELKATIRHFNRRWSLFLETIDLRPVNEARAGYNRYYVLEKECAVRSLLVARQGFSPIPPLVKEELEGMFPYLALNVEH
jgi:hypothetical protein